MKTGGTLRWKDMPVDTITLISLPVVFPEKRTVVASFVCVTACAITAICSFLDLDPAVNSSEFDCIWVKVCPKFTVSASNGCLDFNLETSAAQNTVYPQASEWLLRCISVDYAFYVFIVPIWSRYKIRLSNQLAWFGLSYARLEHFVGLVPSLSQNKSVVWVALVNRNVGCRQF